MKNWKDFLASVLAFILIGGVLVFSYLIASPFIFIFLAFFSFIWIVSVAILAACRICEIVYEYVRRGIQILRSTGATISVQPD